MSCPNVQTGLDIGADPRSSRRSCAAVRPRTQQAADRQADAEHAPTWPPARRPPRTGGADAVSLINTLRAMALAPAARARAARRGPWLGGGTGGLSGPAIRAVALAQVAAVAARVAIPVVGMGGVQSAAHARDLLDVGATLVAVGTESFRDPPRGRADRARAGAPSSCGSGFRTRERSVRDARETRSVRIGDARKPLQTRPATVHQPRHS